MRWIQDIYLFSSLQHVHIKKQRKQCMCALKRRLEGREKV